MKHYAGVKLPTKLSTGVVALAVDEKLVLHPIVADDASAGLYL